MIQRVRSLAMGERDDETGECKREPDSQAVNAIQRDSERMARMLGADLERGAQFGVITAEAMAAFSAPPTFRSMSRP